MENNENLREQAVANIAFRVHALIYLLVNSGLLVIDLLFDNSSSINWFYYAMVKVNGTWKIDSLDGRTLT